MTQPVATLCAAIIVLLGGMFAHAFQKILDRKSEHLREFRDRFHEYVSVVKRSEAHLFDTEGDTENLAVFEYEAAFFSLRVMAPKPVVASLDAHRRALGDLHDQFDAQDDDNDCDFDAVGKKLTRAFGELEMTVREFLGTGATVGPYTRKLK